MPTTKLLPKRWVRFAQPRRFRLMEGIANAVDVLDVLPDFAVPLVRVLALAQLTRG
jgi:hypothetical protein